MSASSSITIVLGLIAFGPRLVIGVDAPPADTRMPKAAEVSREAVLQGATSDPAAVSWGAGRIDLFVRGPDNALWHKTFANGAWSAWVSRGGVLASGPDVASWGPERLDVFARGTDNTLQHTWYDRGWAGRWESLGGGITSDPAAVAWGVGRIDVFARGTDNALWHIAFANAWAGWDSQGGALASGPDVASWGPGRLDIFARGTDNTLQHTWYDQGWAGRWESLGGGIAADPGAVAWGVGRMDVFARGTDNALWHIAFANAWTGWESLGGGITSGPDVSSWGANRLDVFARGTDNTVYQRTFSGAWAGWAGLGAPAPVTVVTATTTSTATTTPTPIASIPVSIAGTPSALVVTWPAVPNVDFYTVDRAKEGDTCCNRSVRVLPTATTITDAVAATPEGAYQYMVTAVMKDYSEVVLKGTYYVYGKPDVQLAPPVNRTNAKIVDPCAPAQVTGGAPPANVTAYQESDTQARVGWDSVPGAAAYLVERQHRTDASRWFKLSCYPGGAYISFHETTHVDVPRDETFYPGAGATYKYKITAFTSAGAAGWNSTTVTVKQAPVGPGSPLTASRTGNSVKLCWKNINTTLFRAERFRIRSSYGTDYSVAGNSQCVTELGVPMGTQTFTVTALHTAIPTFLETPGLTISVLVAP